jgi:hypothetical protein
MEDLDLPAPMLEFVRRHDTFGTPLARSSSRLGHGPLKAEIRVRSPYALLYKYFLSKNLEKKDGSH